MHDLPILGFRSRHGRLGLRERIRRGLCITTLSQGPCRLEDNGIGQSIAPLIIPRRLAVVKVATYNLIVANAE